MKKTCLFIFLFFSLVTVGIAKPVLPEILSDNMVLQQNSHVNLWGKATPGKVVEITPSWGIDVIKTESDEKGDWIASISTPQGGFTPQSISISDGEMITISNVLIGEVWLASGQSNMEMPLMGGWYSTVLNGNEAIAFSGENKGVRFATIDKTAALEPQESVKGRWKECNPENSPMFSATAYYFATTLSRALNVPVGMIVPAWGGTRIEAWLSREILETYPDVDLSEKAIEAKLPPHRPLLMYNAMIKPLTHYTIKGFIWYQGESNVGQHQVYAQRQADLVNLWRKEWNQKETPFYFVEIAPFAGYGEPNLSAYFREAQFKSLSLIPNSGMICTNDLVEEFEAKNIHPYNKTDVGKRLGFLALAKTYGYTTLAVHGPEFSSMEIINDKIYLSFNFLEGGFNRSADIEGFEIAGEDQVFVAANVTIDFSNQKLIVSHEEILHPKAVRYCFKNYQAGNLKNTRELPMVPFRTDNW